MTIHTNAGASVSYNAVTWLSKEKAVALAIAAHVRRNPDVPGWEVHDVDVVDLGPVERSPKGAMILDRTDLVDRMEF